MNGEIPQKQRCFDGVSSIRVMQHKRGLTKPQILVDRTVNSWHFRPAAGALTGPDRFEKIVNRLFSLLLR